MRYRLAIAVVFVLAVSSPFAARKNKPDPELQRIADSLHVVDSIRTADSLMLARYAVSDASLKQEQVAKRQSDSLDAVLREEALKNQSHEETLSSTKTIFIEPTHPLAPVIDSLQKEIELLQKKVYGSDSRFAKMATYSSIDKKRYMEYLLNNSMKDTLQVYECCKNIHTMMNLEEQKLRTILEATENGNSRASIALYLRKIKTEMGELGQFMLALTQKDPEKFPG